MNRVLSVSLGSSRRDHATVEVFGGQKFLVERQGTDGDKAKAIAMIRQFDGKVAAFGLGGTDLYIYAGRKRYTFRESAQIAQAARLSPIVDGSGIKNTLERRVVNYLEVTEGVDFSTKKVLIVCAVDRFGLAEALVNAGSDVVFGDLMFGLGWPLPIRSLKSLARFAGAIAPIITQLPISLFYPTGQQQNEIIPKFAPYFQQADIIAGDFHFIRRYMPAELNGKIVITNTVTAEDIQLLRARGVRQLVTTTPNMGGRSFGTNILEALLVAYSGKKPQELTAEDYGEILDKLAIQPRVVDLSVLNY
jgi:hypothetical protein